MRASLRLFVLGVRWFLEGAALGIGISLVLLITMAFLGVFK